MLRFRNGVWAVVLALAAGRPGFAGDPPGGPDRASDLEDLRMLIEAQQREIGELKRQMTLAADQDADKGRAEMMRKQIREILNEREFRESLMPSVLTSGYDNGFYIRSSDDKFMMKFNGLLQFRWTHYGTRSENRYLLPRFHRDDRTGFDVQRVRFAVSGHAYDPNLTYHIEFKSDAPQQGNFVFDSGWIEYKFRDEFRMRFGQFGLASTRGMWMGGGDMQFVDASMVEAVYGLGAGIGVRFWGELFDKRLDYYFDVVNGTADDGNTQGGRTITNDPAQNDNNLAVLFRTVWHALGDKPGAHMISEADLDFTQSPALDLGFHYAFNDVDKREVGTTRLPVPRLRPLNIPGGYALVPSDGVQFNQFGFDSAFKWMGWSLHGMYALRIIDPRRASFDRFPYSPWYLASGDRSTTVQHGAYVQTGYFLPIPGLEKKLEFVARVGGISTLAERQEGSWEYAAGFNYYINGNKVKLQTDVTKIYEVPTTSSYSSLANVNDDALVFRVQLQLAF